MANLLNGAGALAAISVLPMLAGLILREGTGAVWLRRVAIVLAIALPAMFMLLAAFVYLNQSGTAFFDFSVNYDAAQGLYQHGISPYAVPGAYSFPFPTFYVYWLASLFGTADKSLAWVVWWIANAGIWLLCAVVLWRLMPQPQSPSPRIRDTLLYMAVAIPGATTLWQGQTALLILMGLVAIHRAVRASASEFTRFDVALAGTGLAWATLIKPQLALVGVGIGLWALLQARRNERQKARHALMILGAALIGASALIGATLLLPGGVTLDMYRQFFMEALPQVARPGDSIAVIGSPAFAAASLVVQAGGSAATGDIVANGVTFVVLLGAATWTVRRADHPLSEIAAGWAVWAMVAPRVTWTWYAAWCLPFFLLAVQDSWRGRGGNVTIRLALFVVVLGLLNLQVEQAAVAFGTIALLIALLWTSFQAGGETRYA